MSLPISAAVERRPDATDPKLRAPYGRRQLVPRPRLVDRLLATATPIVTVVAPPGYGKTAMLTQWEDVDPRPFAWVCVDDKDNDPTVLLGWLAKAFARLAGTSPVLGRPTVRRVGALVASLGRPIVLVVDDAHAVHELSAVDTITDLLPYLPPGSLLALAGRSQPVTIGRLRVEVDVLELDAGDLALDERETYAVLALQGSEVDERTARAVQERTEGWAAAVSLAATAARRGAELPLGFSGDQSMVAEYIHSEVMARLDPETVDFLHESAVVEPMIGAALDEVLERSGSAQLLELLAAENHLVLKLDSRQDRFRYHGLLRQLLLSELDRRSPDRARELRMRAAARARREGDALAALAYAYEAGDLDGAVHDLVVVGQPLWASGHGATVETWFTRLEQRGVLERHPEAAALWALMLALDGRAAEAERWTVATVGAETTCPLPDGSSDVRAWSSLVAALSCDGGPARMRALALEASTLLAPSSVLLATATGLTAIATVMESRDEQARIELDDVCAMARHRGANMALAVTLAELALLHGRARRLAPAQAAVDEALAVVAERGLDSYPLSGIVHAAAAVVCDLAGDEPGRQAAVAHFDVFRPRLTHAMPYISVHARLAVAGLHRAHGQWEAARTLLTEMQAILSKRPHLGRYVADVAAMEQAIGDRRGGSPGATTLTVAELRLLPLLPTHLSFRGIGERLFLSPHTIKTQALSIYRKLGVSSRDEAVTRARELGLLYD